MSIVELLLIIITKFLIGVFYGLITILLFFATYKILWFFKITNKGSEE
jgi:hypothetical protein